MARIRTIKPDFFTSDDICLLSPLARILYIGLWCEADRQGRLQWSPKTLKRRYLPDDNCDIDAVCMELLKRDLVRLYGEELAFIPTFLEHQKPNPREAESTLPAPDVHPSNLDLHASNPDVLAQVGREGKGKERKGMDAASPRVSHATEIPDDFQPSEEDLAAVRKARPDLTPAMIADETVRFINHAKANARTAMNWGPNWRNWMFKAAAPTAAPVSKFAKPDPQALPPTDPWEQRLQGWNTRKQWLSSLWGPPPGESGCRVPRHLIGETA